MTQGPIQGMFMGGRRGPPLLPLQQMKIMPPIANSLEEALAHAPSRKPLSPEAIELARNYLSQGKRYSDRKVIRYMADQGYQFTRSDVTIARALIAVENDKF